MRVCINGRIYAYEYIFSFFCVDVKEVPLYMYITHIPSVLNNTSSLSFRCLSKTILLLSRNFISESQNHLFHHFFLCVSTIRHETCIVSTSLSMLRMYGDKWVPLLLR